MFEFTWNIVLRSRQIELVRETLAKTGYQTGSDGGARIKQMLMGGRKARASARASARTLSRFSVFSVAARDRVSFRSPRIALLERHL